MERRDGGRQRRQLIARCGSHPEACEGVQEVVHLRTRGRYEAHPPETYAIEEGAPGLSAGATSLRQLNGPSPIQIEEDDLRVSFDHDRLGLPITQNA